MARKRYVTIDGVTVDKDTGEPLVLPEKPPWLGQKNFLIVKDYDGYACPVTGAWIEGKRAHEENLKRHGCRVLEKGEREDMERDRRHEERKLEERIERTVVEIANAKL